MNLADSMFMKNYKITTLIWKNLIVIFYLKKLQETLKRMEKPNDQMIYTTCFILCIPFFKIS